MSFLELAWKRKSIRNFKSDDIPVETLHLLLDAARSAPSAGNCQPWHFYVIKDSSVKARLNAATGGQQKFIDNAPVAIVVCAMLEQSAKRYENRGAELYSLQDTAAAIQNLLLCATDIGLAACWCGAFDESAVTDALGLDGNSRPVAIIPIGYAVYEPAKTSRRPLDEICTFLGFDTDITTESEAARPAFEHVDLGGALFNDLNLAGSEFVNINMTDCVIHDVNLSGTEISNSDLTKLEINGCKIDGLTVNGVDISGLLSPN